VYLRAAGTGVRPRGAKLPGPCCRNGLLDPPLAVAAAGTVRTVRKRGYQALVPLSIIRPLGVVVLSGS